MGNSDHGTAYIRVGGDDGELRPWHYIRIHRGTSLMTCGDFENACLFL